MADAWTIPENQRPMCPLSGKACTSWTCLVDVCAERGDERPATEVERLRVQVSVESKISRDILEAMCKRHGLSLISPFDADKPAANYVLAQRLGIGSVFGLPDNEEPPKTTVRFAGGPWDGQTTDIGRVVGPVFAVGHEIGNHYWLNSKSGNTPTYHWDGTEWGFKDA